MADNSTRMIFDELVEGYRRSLVANMDELTRHVDGEALVLRAGDIPSLSSIQATLDVLKAGAEALTTLLAFQQRVQAEQAKLAPGMDLS